MSNPPLPWLILFFEINNIHIKEFFLHMPGPPLPIANPHLRTPPPYPQNVDNLPFFGTLPIGGIWLGLTPYRLPIDTLSKYTEPWLQQTRGRLKEA